MWEDDTPLCGKPRLCYMAARWLSMRPLLPVALCRHVPFCQSSAAHRHHFTRSPDSWRRRVGTPETEHWSTVAETATLHLLFMVISCTLGSGVLVKNHQGASLQIGHVKRPAGSERMQFIKIRVTWLLLFLAARMRKKWLHCSSWVTHILSSSVRKVNTESHGRYFPPSNSQYLS